MKCQSLFLGKKDFFFFEMSSAEIFILSVKIVRIFSGGRLGSKNHVTGKGENGRNSG